VEEAVVYLLLSITRWTVGGGVASVPEPGNEARRWIASVPEPGNEAREWNLVS